MHEMPALLTVKVDIGIFLGWKNILPGPFLRCVNVLPVNCEWNRNSGTSVQSILFVQLPYSAKFLLQVWHQRFGQQCTTVFSPLAITNSDLQIFEIDILNTQAKALDQPYTAPVEHAGSEPVAVMQCVENSAHFSSSHNDGYTHWSPGQILGESWLKR